MSIERVICTVCGGLIGARDTGTGEEEYAKGARSFNEQPYCSECYNRSILSDVPTLGGCNDEEDILYEE